MQLYGNIRFIMIQFLWALLVLLTKKLKSTASCGFELSLYFISLSLLLMKKINNPKIWTLELKLFHSFSLYTAFMMSHHQIIFPNSYQE